MRRTVVAVLLVLLPVSSPSAHAASFDCAAARTADEVAICDNRELNDLDVKMATLFAIATGLVAMGERGTIRDEQREWLAQRGACGDDVRCLTRSYRRRIAALETVLDEIKSRGPY